MNGRQTRPERKRVDAGVVGVNQRIGAHVSRLRPTLQRTECRHYIFRSLDPEHIDFHSGFPGRRLGGMIFISNARLPRSHKMQSKHSFFRNFSLPLLLKAGLSAARSFHLRHRPRGWFRRYRTAAG
jgi:hypothetical protein